ncbi:MAG: signal transduction histidine kinase [Bacteroidetes bacterium]|nr:signal transduction histidine kinase [Bacteroidota bacterium]
MRHLFWGAALSVVLQTAVFAQPNFVLPSGEKRTGKAGEHFSRFDFQHFNVENGLSQGTIRAVLQDHNGFIWIGTNDGLNRFDGVEYRTFRHRFQDPTSLSDNTITSLYEDHEKTLWVGTLVGLHRFDGAKESFTRIVYVKDDSTRVTEYRISSIYETRIRGETALWVVSNADDHSAFDGRSLSFVDRKKNELHSVVFNRHGQEGKTLAKVFAIAQDHEGIIWMVTFDGLLRVDPRLDSLENVLSFVPPAATLVISRNDADNALWIGTPNGLLKFDRRHRKTIFQLPYHVTSLLEDRKGRLWVGTGTGLILLGQDGSREATITVGEQGSGSGGLTDNYILALCEDASGALCCFMGGYV